MELKVLSKPVSSEPSFSSHYSSALSSRYQQPAFKKACSVHFIAAKMFVTDRPALIKYTQGMNFEERKFKAATSAVSQLSNRGDVSSKLNLLQNFENAEKSNSCKADEALYRDEKAFNSTTVCVESRENGEGNTADLQLANKWKLPKDSPNLTQIVHSTKANETFESKLETNCASGDLKSPVKRSGKRKNKSGKKKRQKSNKQRLKHKTKNLKEHSEISLPVKKELSSCFSVYSSQIGNKPKFDKSRACIDLRNHPPNNVQLRSSTSNREKRNRDLPLRRSSDELVAPLSKSINLPHSRTSNQRLLDRKKLSETNNQLPFRSVCWSLSTLQQPIARNITSSQLPNHTDGISLPLTPAIKLSKIREISSKIDKIQQNKALVRAYTNNDHNTNFKPIRFHREWDKNGNTLSGRLGLIHHYGHDYHIVTQQMELERKKEIFLQQQKTKAVEKEAKEKKKHEQRKKIYALNKIMTAIEKENFNKFMETLGTAY